MRVHRGAMIRRPERRVRRDYSNHEKPILSLSGFSVAIVPL
jgi:hypothetical protein